MIRKAQVEDIPNILQITRRCATHMQKQNIYQWNEHYPSEAAFKKDIQRNELYVLIKNNEFIGCIVISNYKDEEYEDIIWLTQSSSTNVYIHRLAVDPKYQGQGYAQKLMTFAENYAQEKEYHSVRLDTFSQNLRNNKFYKRRGYQKLGDIYFPKQSEYPFHCYELVLKA